MKMKVIEVDESGEEQSSYDDNWKLDPIIFSINDYMTPTKIPLGEFGHSWDAIS